MLQLSLELPRKHFTIMVDIEVHTGTCLCLFGPSASGKTSILSAIAGFETRYHRAYLSVDDHVLIDTRAKPAVVLPPWKRQISYIEQSARLFPHLTVEQNILYGMHRHEDKAWFDRIVDAIGLQNELTSRPNTLSGGMAQRVALARALATRPSVLLLDEPFSALDRGLRSDLQDLVKSLRRELAVTMILVTHQFTEAQRLADEIAVIDQGVILQVDSPFALLMRPNSWRCAQLMGYTAALQGQDGTQVFIHPDRVLFGSHPNQGTNICGVVEDVTWYDGRKRVQITPDRPWRTLSGRFEVHLSPVDVVQIGDHVELTTLAPQDC